jgi:hypothetical protein
MHALRSRPVSQRRLAWLLWFGLLFPVAQASAAWHALSHTPQEARRAADDKQAPDQTHCDLCLMAAAVGGGAPLAELPAVIALAIDPEPPQAATVDVWLALPARAYRSRAPPLASR